MVVKFGVQQQRGSAGESAMGPKRGYNFANLYAQNRADGQVNQKAAGFEQQARGAHQDMTDSIGALNRPGGNNGQSQNQMANAVNRAKGISNQAQGFNPAVSMMKSGASPYQAGVGSFYAGGKNSTGAQKIRSFGNLYEQMQGRAQNAIDARGEDPSVVAASPKPGLTKGMQEQVNTDNHNIADNVQNVRGAEGSQVNRLSNLDWMLKTGRITSEQYYAAQRDDAAYDNVMLNFNK